MILRLWLLLVLMCAGALAPSRAQARGAETRTWDFFAATANARPESAPQVADPHQGNLVCGYELALGYSQAAESAVARGGAGPVLQGQAGVTRAVGQIEANGGTILGREITLEAGGVRTRPDLLVRTADGRTIFVEVKNGPGAGLTPNQTTGFPVIRSGGAIPRGGNAANAGLPVGQPLPPTPVEVIHFP